MKDTLPTIEEIARDIMVPSFDKICSPEDDIKRTVKILTAYHNQIIAYQTKLSLTERQMQRGTAVQCSDIALTFGCREASDEIDRLFKVDEE